MEELDSTPQQEPTYNDDDIKTLDWMEHIRRRPGMYIGKLGDGSYPDDGIYVLLKEVLDNSIDEYMMGYGRTIEVTIEAGTVEVRDYGRGVPLGKVVDVSSKMNTGAKYDSKAFKKSVGLNGVGIKAVNALSSDFQITSYRDGECKRVEYNRAIIKEESGIQPTDEANGTRVYFVPDNTIFKDYHYKEEYIENLLKNYVFLNSGLTINFNGKKFFSRHGLVDLLNENMTTEPLYPIIHLKGDDIELVITHSNQYGEEYYSFVNGQLTTQGGTHLSACSPHKAVRISRLSRSRSVASSKSITTRISNIRIFARALWPPSASRWRNPSSRARPRQNWARKIWVPTAPQYRSS